MRQGLGNRFSQALRLGSVLGLLVLLPTGGAAWAKGPNPAQSPAGCDAKRVILINAAVAQAERLTEAALAFLVAQPYHPHVRTWFGAAPPEKIRARLTATLERLRPNRRPPFLCGGPESSCGTRPVFAVANLTRGTVTLCTMFFNARNDGADSRPGVIVHEITHLAAGTGDHAYGRTSAMALARKEPDRAALNADNYEYFVEFLPTLMAQPAARPAPRPKGR